MTNIPVPELNLVNHDDRACGKKFVKKSENCLPGPKGGTVWVENLRGNCLVQPRRTALCKLLCYPSP